MLLHFSISQSYLFLFMFILVELTNKTTGSRAVVREKSLNIILISLLIIGLFNIVSFSYTILVFYICLYM